MKNNSKILALALSISIGAGLSGCRSNSTGSEVGDKAYKSFSAILKADKDKIGFHAALSHWGLKLNNSEKFEWTKDTSANTADLAMVMLADPFINAGLDVKKLDANQWLYKPAEKEAGEQLPNRLVKPYNVGDKKEETEGFEDAMKNIIKTDSSLITYNSDSKKYVISLGKGFEVQWTEALGTTSSDIVFVLDSKPLTAAGLDLNKLDGSGWKVEDNNLVKEYKLK